MNAERRLVYLVGEPGVGKSTLMGRVAEPWQRHCIAEHPRRELLLERHRVRGCELGGRLGRHAPGFPGTDALPMNAVVSVENWLLSGQAATETPLILGEGARLAVRRFFDAAVHAGWRTHVVFVRSDHAARNRAARGSTQSAAWIKGAATRADRVFAYATSRVGRDGIAGAHILNADDTELAAATLRELTGLEVPCSTAPSWSRSGLSS